MGKHHLISPRLIALLAALGIVVLASGGAVWAQTTTHIYQLLPDCKIAGSAGFTLTVVGDFDSSSTYTVYWNGGSRYTKKFSQGVLEATIYAADVLTAGTAEVTIAATGGPASNALTFTIKTANPTPSISSISPVSIVVGYGDFTLTIHGDSFINQSKVLWNGAARTTTFIDCRTLTASIAAADVAQIGDVSIMVLNDAPGGTTSNTVAFAISQFASQLLFPQIAVGGGYSTVVRLVNTGSRVANAMLTIMTSEGNPMTARGTLSTGVDMGTASLLNVTIPTGGFRIVTLTDPANDTLVRSGWLGVDSAGIIDGIVTFQAKQGSVLTALAGVLPAPLSSSAVIPVDNNSAQNRQTSIAIANPSRSAVEIRLQFVNADGYSLPDIVKVTVPANGQISKYLYQLYSGSSNFEGSVVLTPSVPANTFTAVAMENNQGLMTVIPVIQ